MEEFVARVNVHLRVRERVPNFTPNTHIPNTKTPPPLNKTPQIRKLNLSSLRYLESSPQTTNYFELNPQNYFFVPTPFKPSLIDPTVGVNKLYAL